MSDDYKSDESKTVKKLKDMNNIGRITKPINVKIPGTNINLHPLIIKLINAGKTVLKKYGFDESFNIFD